jgi:hypothetical protein
MDRDQRDPQSVNRPNQIFPAQPGGRSCGIGEQIMALSFPNESRSYDAARHMVRFWGYDSVMEASFSVDSDSLRRMDPGLQPDETEILRVFDSNLPAIHAAAFKVYRRGHKGSFDLTPANF